MNIKQHAKETVKLFFQQYIGYDKNISEDILDVISKPTSLDIVSLVTHIGHEPTQNEKVIWSKAFKQEFRK